MNFKSGAYCVMYREVDGKTVFEDKSLLKDFKLIKNPLFHWCADPFPIVLEGKRYIFAEIASYLSRKGNVGFICLDDKKPKWKKCFKPKYHISFPNIYKDGDDVKAIPETYQDGCVARYAIDQKGFAWSKEETVLVSPFAVDTCYDPVNKKFLITYENEANGSPKTPHLNIRSYKDPTKIFFTVADCRGQLRPAGNCFEHKGKLIFPSQDCSDHYGGGVIFNVLDAASSRVCSSGMTLYPNDLKPFLPGMDVTGCHTYNHMDGIEVIDVVFTKFAITGVLQKIKSKLGDKIRKRTN